MGLHGPHRKAAPLFRGGVGAIWKDKVAKANLVRHKETCGKQGIEGEEEDMHKLQ